MINQFSCNRLTVERRTASRKQRAYILLKQKNKCFTCGNFNANLEVDHVIPYAVGGVTELYNLRALCPNCHAEKSRNSDEADKIRFSKRLKFTKCELCWTCEKIVSPYFFKTGECFECTLQNDNKSTLRSKYKDKIWIIPTSPISSPSPSPKIEPFLKETWSIPASPMSDI